MNGHTCNDGVRNRRKKIKLRTPSRSFVSGYNTAFLTTHKQK
nr:unnamed protein product [Callosobruchus chinensis]